MTDLGGGVVACGCRAEAPAPLMDMLAGWALLLRFDDIQLLGDGASAPYAFFS